MKARKAIALLSLALAAGCGGESADVRPRPPHAVGELECTGSGSPTVVVESGLGVDPDMTWAAVVPQIDRMAAKGILEKNRAAHYKSQINARLRAMA